MNRLDHEILVDLSDLTRESLFYLNVSLDCDDGDDVNNKRYVLFNSSEQLHLQLFMHLD